jgi:formylglycine-generating enzyme
MTFRVLPDPFPPACATAWGDDRYGLWCEITVKGVVQRLRWVEPGVFWMGSTDDERASLSLQATDSFKNWIKSEAPRHRVRLTQGFWLADTACTQALWHALVGHNRSRFKGDSDLPVEQVSWDEVTTTFLPALNQYLAESEVFLPTEAQWEYACRAGTKTAYNFGETITKDQVNFGSKRTVPVKTLSVNRWGLCQMQGNVWEWCADAQRTYTEESMTDPHGGLGESGRMLRGGSWHSEAAWTRCAYRRSVHSSNHSGGFGFRFALRSIGPGGQEAGSPGVDGVR